MASIVGAAALLVAAPGPRQAPADRFIVKDLMIPARDGVKLHTKIFTPKDQSGPLPIIMKRTPYGVEGSAGNFNAYMKDLATRATSLRFRTSAGSSAPRARSSGSVRRARRAIRSRSTRVPTPTRRSSGC